MKGVMNFTDYAPYGRATLNCPCGRTWEAPGLREPSGAPAIHLEYAFCGGCGKPGNVTGFQVFPDPPTPQ